VDTIPTILVKSLKHIIYHIKTIAKSELCSVLHQITTGVFWADFAENRNFPTAFCGSLHTAFKQNLLKLL
jgi:hypothetical protein